MKSGAPKGHLMSSSGISPADPLGVREPPADKPRVLSTRRQVLTNWVSGRMLQPTIEPVVTNSSVSLDL